MLYESQTFRLEADDQILTLWLDFRGRPNHALTFPALNELSLVLDRISALPAADALLIRSSRPGAFLEEFDTAELARLSSPLEFAALARRGQDVARKLERLGTPSVGLIEGRCAGAGLELALACTYRLASDGPATRFEAAEAERGLIPAWGGAHRLRRRLGLRPAVRLLLGGTTVGPADAGRLGLVDRVLPAGRLAVDLLAALDRVRAGRPLGKRARYRRAWDRIAGLWDHGWLKGAVRRAGDPQGAGAELFRVLAAGLSSEGEGLAAERAALSRLGGREESRNLLALHRQAAAPVRVFPEPVNPGPHAPRRVAIVGAGDRASDLAGRLVGCGHEVVIHDPDAAALDRAGRRIAADLAGRAGRPSDGARFPQTLRTTSAWAGVDDADLVIEAGDEDPGVKRNLFHEVERRVRPRTVIATAGATVPVEAIQAEAVRPARVAGLHFPVACGPRAVAEIVGTALTDPGTVAALARWSMLWGFTPVRVADRPGRLVDLVRLVYLSEAVTLVAEGLPADRVDDGCRRFGMARGPLEWCDEIGLEPLAELTAQVQLARGDGFARNLLFQRLIPYGCVGKAVGEGFYRYGWGRRPSALARMLLWNDLDEDATAPYVFDPDGALRDGVERVILRTVNETAAALADEPDSDPATADLALAFGMGWAPTRGGPLRYADHLGLSAVVDRLGQFAERFGRRFVPCDELVRRAEAGETFYGGPPVEHAAPAPAWRMAG